VTEQPNAMSVEDVQRALRSLGFFPGGKIDGICGYRTQSAIRVFQEYVRSIEKLDCVPDGRFGPNSQSHLQRWLHNRLLPDWSSTVERWHADTLEETEYTGWLALLNQVKARCVASPNRMLQMVNGYPKPSDTRKVADWDFSPKEHVHLIGIRRNSVSGKFDDIFVLLVKGLVFKFQGSTEPGATKSALGPPFLVLGQHDYHFGWHQRRYLALRPRSLDKGVLVVRSKDMNLDESDLANGLERNSTINIHWGGKGLKFDVKSWSEGCQVITGSVYLNHHDQLIDCSAFAAANRAELEANLSKTRGAYNVLTDLVTAFASDMGGNEVKYTLLAQEHLDLAPDLRNRLADAASRVVSKLQ
jgi:hypothetical protein